MKESVSAQDRGSIELPIAFVNAISDATSIDEVLEAGSRWLSIIIDCPRCSIAYKENGHLIAQGFRSDGRFEPVQSSSQIDETGCRGRVLATGRPVFLDHAGITSAGGPVFQGLLASGIRSILIVPMISCGETIGTIAACRYGDNAFTDRDAEILTANGKWMAGQVRLMQQFQAARRHAQSDELTGLANRARLLAELSAPGALAPRRDDGWLAALLHIDLDHFKVVNDTLGHSAGDAVLVAAARAMRAAAGPQDLIARMGGDEFVILTRTDPQQSALRKLAADLVLRIGMPVNIDGIEANIGASIGTSVATTPDCTPDQLITNADLALYEVKRSGRRDARAFDQTMRDRYNATQRLIVELQDAVAASGFEPYFQPQISVTTGQLTGFEVLARWPHPVLGVLGPDIFMDLALESRLLDQIDAIVRIKALASLRELRARGRIAPKLSVNTSAAMLRDSDFVDRLLCEVLEQGLIPSDLVLEVREAHLIHGPDGAIQGNIAALAGAGFSIVLDDFGTGCAAMANLATPAITGIKLDRTLVSLLPRPGSEKVLRAIIALAEELDLTVAASGIESAAQFAILRRLGCATVQGYAVAAPMAFDDLVAFIRDLETSSAAHAPVPADHPRLVS